MARTAATPPTDRGRRWASTMAGFPEPAPAGYPPADEARASGLRLAHADSSAIVGPAPEPDSAPPPHLPVGLDRQGRETAQDVALASGATRARGAGDRARPEEPDPWRTCFERDRDRVLHAAAFRRLAGKTQVFVFPEDHLRTRLTHALEVAQVATSVARACRLNVELTEAIALGHDCGHGPGGHASEDALDPYLPGGFDHAPWGAEVSLASLNLCRATLDGIANHSWSRPAPRTPEGEVVSWADRIAYVCHDWEDAVRTGIVAPGLLPPAVRSRCGERRGAQLGAFIDALTSTTLRSGRVAMDEEMATVLGDFRACNYEHIYLREASVAQANAVVAVLRALVEHYCDRPNAIPAVREAGGLSAGEPAAVHAAVAYVAGMTDRFACRQAVALLGWDPDKLPQGIDA
ncbi:MAG TPA: HD domain-containing protein [Acidimicrobiales bacterium]|nr:HD domain-containing protein [Acidimicrobiales bacterium]